MLQSNVGPGLLARALMTLARRSASGEVGIEAAGGRRAVVRLALGGISGIDHSEGGSVVLGDILMHEGALERELALDEAGRDGSEPIGQFLVRTGRASRGAVEHALRKQMRSRLRTLFEWERPRLGFRSTEAMRADVTVPVAEAVLDALRHSPTPREEYRPLPGEVLTLTSFGRDLLRGAPLRPEEAAVAALLEVNATMDTIASAVHGHARAMRFASVLRRIGAAEPTSASGSYSLLLRKRQELRRSTDARTLLGIAPGSTKQEARRALRRLARDLHPDRFSQAEAGARELSAEVLKALVRAEAEIASDRSAMGAGRAK